MSAVTTARWRGLVVGAAVVVGASACERLTAPSPNFEWDATVARLWHLNLDSSLVDSLVASPQVSAALGAITVRGLLWTPSLCDSAAVRAVTIGQVVDITVRVVQHHGGCFTVSGNSYFEAHAPHRRGQYRLRIRSEGYYCCADYRPLSLDTILTVH